MAGLHIVSEQAPRKQMMTRNLRYEAVYPFPVPLVWQAVSDSSRLAQWLMKNDFRPEIGHRFQFKGDLLPGLDTVNCQVLEFEPPRRICMSWHGGPPETMLTITLGPVPKGTYMVLAHTGFTGFRHVMSSFLVERGWKRLMRAGIPKVLEKM